MTNFYWAPIENSLGKSWKLKMVQRKGGRCLACHYDRCAQALTFHHVNPAEKEIWITRGGGKTYLGEPAPRAEVEAEIENKCILLCCRCHAEVEAGLWTVAELVQAHLLTGARLELTPVKSSLS